MEKESEEEDEISDKNVDNDKDNYVEISLEFQKLSLTQSINHLLPIHFLDIK